MTCSVCRSHNFCTYYRNNRKDRMTDAISGVEIAHPSGAHEFISGP